MEHEELFFLLKKVAAGNQPAFNQLYSITSGQLFAVALKMLKNRDSAEEALQEAYVSIWYKADYYKEGQGTVLTWMVSIIRYRALDMLRSQKVKKEDDLSEDILSELDATETTESGYDIKIEGCMKELDQQQRQAIHLAYFNGLSHSEVVEHLDHPLGTIKSWIRRGLTSLQRCLGI
ncbi:sigma-70 family RNA polymerase sigma factor [Brumicola pallidula]|jgi:RNA polymerase sigma-70 factor (ECF subfamily)|uniref:RNA polymerase sigma-70 factor, ECF subfamily n=1 Tax=Brumicola pallidula DSM 14239 = ACAM 615 TaxID=1121922 RepID=K6ZGG6_9ALTE|nr:sigma-70 family RNA polymerase sigma factor [Glaciecola pallidula]GAC28018.1 RNA polymerase sigma-70 factor, ECF subfamily [Glaciecola pallidula DSM 14239 = ACAM 615]